MSNYRVDRQKWAKMTIFEQMGNIYSEVGRSFTAKKQGDEERSNQASYRAIDLFDATVDVLIISNPHRAKEVLRSKDQYLSALHSNNKDDMQPIDNYFLQYAIVARR